MVAMVMMMMVEAIMAATAVKSAMIVELAGIGEGAVVQVEQIDLVNRVVFAASSAAIFDHHVRDRVLIELVLKSRLIIWRQQMMIELRRVVIASAYLRTGRHVGTRVAARRHGRILVAMMAADGRRNRGRRRVATTTTTGGGVVHRVRVVDCTSLG